MLVRNWKDIETVGKLKLAMISICFCSDSHPCLLFYETCQKENVKYIYKAYVAPIAFIIIQFKEGVQYLGQFDFSRLLEIRKSCHGSSEKLMIILKPIQLNC